MRHSTASFLNTVGYTRRAAHASASRSAATSITATEKESARSEAPMFTASTESMSESWSTGWWWSTIALTQIRSLGAPDTERFPVAVTEVHASDIEICRICYDPRPSRRLASSAGLREPTRQLGGCLSTGRCRSEASRVPGGGIPKAAGS